MQRGLVAGVIVVVVAVAIAAFFLTGSEDSPVSEGGGTAETAATAATTGQTAGQSGAEPAASQGAAQGESQESTAQTQTQTTGTQTTGTGSSGTESPGTQAGEPGQVVIREVVRATTEGAQAEGTAEVPASAEGVSTQGGSTQGTSTQGASTQGTSTQTTSTQGGASQGTAGQAETMVQPTEGGDAGATAPESVQPSEPEASAEAGSGTTVSGQAATSAPSSQSQSQSETGQDTTAGTSGTAESGAGAATATQPAPESQSMAQTVPEAGDESASAGASSGTQTAALPPDAAPKPMSPLFDIVRVEPNGDAVIAGRAEPGSIVILLDGEIEIARVVADSVGAWVIILDRPLRPGDHQLGLRAELPDGTVVLSETLVIVSVPQPSIAVAEAEPEAQSGATGESGGAAGAEGQTEATGGASAASEGQVAAVSEPEVPLTVEMPRDDLGATRILQQPTGDGLRDRALLLNAVDYNADGYIVVSGQADPGSRVIVYLDEKPLGTALADANGRWQLAPPEPVASGLHRLRVDQVDEKGDVLARVATLFSRAELAGGFPENRYVIVQPGNSLWRIARRTMGHGIHYSVIFDANDEQIQDPDLIYPGQIFVLPSTQ